MRKVWSITWATATFATATFATVTFATVTFATVLTVGCGSSEYNDRLQNRLSELKADDSGAVPEEATDADAQPSVDEDPFAETADPPAAGNPPQDGNPS